MTAEGAARRRVAFVVQRCGVEVNGGAELHCLHLAQRMARWWQTEVLTTCALDYVHWDNFYEPGAVEIGATTVRRFRVDEPRDVAAFDRLSCDIQWRNLQVDLATQENWMRAQGPLSEGLLEYIHANSDRYDAFIFFGYLYFPTYFGLPLVASKAYLVPLAHDEWPIYMTMFDRLFASPRDIIFNTEAERAFLRRRLAGVPLEGKVIGVGVDEPPATKPEDFRNRYALDGPLLLYVGRIDKSKGADVLLDYFIRAQEEGRLAHKLVLIGRDAMSIPFHDAIVHLGFVSEQEKWDAIAACDWLIVPSPHESLSIVLLEAWRARRPALVNGRCEVLRAHCAESHGGLCYESYEEWLAALTSITEDEREALGQQGAAYVESRYSWSRIERDYLSLLGGGSAQ